MTGSTGHLSSPIKQEPLRHLHAWENPDGMGIIPWDIMTIETKIADRTNKLGLFIHLRRSHMTMVTATAEFVTFIIEITPETDTNNQTEQGQAAKD